MPMRSSFRLISPPHSSGSSDTSSSEDSSENVKNVVDEVRSLAQCIDIFENGPRPLSESLALLNDEEVIMLAQCGKIAAYSLEKVLGMNELERAVRIRRALISRASSTQTLEASDIPLADYDYSKVLGACCENVVGYIPIPLGIAGPLYIDGTLYPIPMATAEGTLVASASRGCKALNAGGGVTTVLTQDAMTRGPAIDFPSIVDAASAKIWIDSPEGYLTIKKAFESTSRFAKLKSLKTAMAGRTLYVRFATSTGDAMGMNMISKGTEKALEVMQERYPGMVVLALSGNYCTDKKPAAINWIEGRGKSVVAEAVIPGHVVKTVLKTTVAALVNLNTKKNLVGSAMAGSIGGFNAHAANILTAIFLATGQDPAQNVESSMCMTLMEAVNDGEDLLMTVSMPCIEVGTVGGGTVLGPQKAVLEMLGLKGAHPTKPGQNSQGLARLIAAAVMAGELSLLGALAAGHLIRAHMQHNRSQVATPAVVEKIPVTAGVKKGAIYRPHLVRETSSVGVLTPSSSTSSLPPYTQLTILYFYLVSNVKCLDIHVPSQVQAGTATTVGWETEKGDMHPDNTKFDLRFVQEGTDIGVAVSNIQPQKEMHKGSVEVTFPSAGTFKLKAVAGNGDVLGSSDEVTVTELSPSTTSTDSPSPTPGTDSPSDSPSADIPGASTTISSTSLISQTPSTSPPAQSQTTLKSSSTSNIPAIVGGAIGGLLALSLLAFLFIFLRRRRHTIRKRLTFHQDMMVQRRVPPPPSFLPGSGSIPSSRRGSDRSSSTGNMSGNGINEHGDQVSARGADDEDVDVERGFGFGAGMGPGSVDDEGYAFAQGRAAYGTGHIVPSPRGPRPSIKHPMSPQSRLQSPSLSPSPSQQQAQAPAQAQPKLPLRSQPTTPLPTQFAPQRRL
ncbi:hypothetical protein CVT25_005343 [Psilocybe cyanescens]|uniref:3-hydroxy-3-methylglutaryl coenzyme A reductase n=1 Tax=Psilocybe cyanescens TaxID=93625 RepID=A0A409WWR4_PSICY|nr:hypothetical protein CVT25_005343 [Psilocybe cyanescens]